MAKKKRKEADRIAILVEEMVTAEDADVTALAPIIIILAAIFGANGALLAAASLPRFMWSGIVRSFAWLPRCVQCGVNSIAAAALSAASLVFVPHPAIVSPVYIAFLLHAQRAVGRQHRAHARVHL